MQDEMPDSIQSREHSRGGDLDSVPCNSDGDPNLLNSNRNDDGRWLNANYDRSDDKWNDNGGFAFVVPQLSSFPRQELSRRGFVFYRLGKIAVPPA